MVSKGKGIREQMESSNTLIYNGLDIKELEDMLAELTLEKKTERTFKLYTGAGGKSMFENSVTLSNEEYILGTIAPSFFPNKLQDVCELEKFPIGEIEAFLKSIENEL